MYSNYVFRYNCSGILQIVDALKLFLSLYLRFFLLHWILNTKKFQLNIIE